MKKVPVPFAHSSDPLTQDFFPVERPTENWTKCPNCILDNLDKFTPMECKILMLMVRKNYGYQQPSMKFSLTYICREIGHGKDAVIKAIDGLLEKESIKVVETGKQGVRFFDINWVAPIEIGRKIRPVGFSDRSGKPTDIGREIEPVSFIKETIKRNELQTEPKPAPKVVAKEKTEGDRSSFVFSDNDFKQLIEAVPEKRKSSQIGKRLVKGLQDGHSVTYLLDCIAYAHDKATDNFLGYLGNLIDVYGVKEGYHQEAEEKRKKAEAAATKKRDRSLADRRQQQMRAENQATLKAKREQMDALLKSVDLDALDAFIDDQDLNPFSRTRFNLGKRDGLRRQYMAKFCENNSEAVQESSEPMPVKQPDKAVHIVRKKSVQKSQKNRLKPIKCGQRLIEDLIDFLFPGNGETFAY